MRIEDVFTKELAETTSEMAVVDVMRNKTGAFLYVTTTKTRAFQDAMINLSIVGGGNASSSPEVVGSLICGWSFEDVFTPENAVKLLSNAPHLIIDVFNTANAHTEKCFDKKKPLSIGKKTKAS